MSKSFETREEARRWAQRLEGRIAADDFVDMSEARRTTLGEALERYLSEVTPHKKGARQEASRIACWLRDPIALRPLASIRSADIAEWRSARVRAGDAPTTIKNALTVISQVYSTAAAEWGIEGLRNPVRGVRMPANRPGRDRRLEAGEEERLLEACVATGCVWLRPAFTWALETGMRMGELLRVRRADIKGRVVSVALTKTGQPRSVPLSTRALGAISDLPLSVDGRLFPLTEWQLRHYFQRACKLAGVNGLRWHDLRHEATSRLFERGLDMIEVMAITGHRTTAMLTRYTHLRADRLAEKLG